MVLSVLLRHSTWHLYRKVIERNPNGCTSASIRLKKRCSCEKDGLGALNVC